MKASIYYACTSSVKYVKLLIDKWADLNTRYNDGNTAFMLAVICCDYSNSAKCVKLLINECIYFVLQNKINVSVIIDVKKLNIFL